MLQGVYTLVCRHTKVHSATLCKNVVRSRVNLTVCVWKYTVLHCVNMWVYGNTKCVCDHRDRDGERQKEGDKGEIESGTDSSDTCSISPPPSSPCSPLSSAAEGKRRRSPTPTSTQSTCRRPCSSWIQCPLPLFVCLLRCHLAAISLQPVPGYTATSTEVLFHQMPIFCPRHAKIQWQTALFYVSVS